MRIFPPIKFVDKMPKEIIEYCNLNENQIVSGFCMYKPKLQIYILNQNRKWLTVLHELGHWFLHTIKAKRKYHKWLDEYFTIYPTGKMFRKGKT